MNNWDRVEDLAARMQHCKDELAAIAREAAPLVDGREAEFMTVMLGMAAGYVGEVMEETGFLPSTRFNITDFGEEHRDLVPVADPPIRWSEELAT